MKTRNAILMLILSGVGLMIPAVYAENPSEVTMESLLQSSDIVLTENAMTGAPVSIVAHPEEIEGGKVLKTNLGMTISAIASAWRMDPRSGLENLPQSLTPGGSGGGAGTLITNAEFTSDVSGWTAVNAFGGQTNFGSDIAAPAGSLDGRFAVAHTGPWGNSGQGSLEQGFRVNTPKDMIFNIVYNFISTDWPSSVGWQFNDNAIVTVSNAAGTEIQFALFESINSSTFTPVGNLPNSPSGNIYNPNVFNYFQDISQQGGQTGWLTATSPSIYFDRGDYKVRIEVNDAADLILDAAILVDMVGLQ